MLIRFVDIVTFIGLASILNLARVVKAQEALKQVFVQQPCDPPVGIVRYGKQPNSQVSNTLKALYQTDQKARQQPSNEIDWKQVSKEDRDRRIAVITLLREGKLFTADDYFYAAMIFQHGNCPDHFKLTNTLAGKAMSLGHPDASWLYAASLDRYLLNTGKPQKYGTQYESGPNCTFVLSPVDPKTTDAERLSYNVPSLAVAKAGANRFGSSCPK